MAATTGTIPVADAANAPRLLKTLNDNNDGTTNPAHPLLNAAAAVINPATAENQAAAAAALAAIRTAVEKIPTGGATAALQTAAGAQLDAIAANTAAGGVNLTAAPAVAATTHAADDVVGGKIALTNAVRNAAGSGVIQTVIVHTRDALSAPYDVLFFNADPVNSTFADDATINVAAADQPALVGVAQCTTVISCGTLKAVQAANVALPFKLAAGTTLYAVVVARGPATYTTANGVTLNAAVLQD